MANALPEPDHLAAAVEVWGIGSYEWQHAEARFIASPRFRELYELPAGTDIPADWPSVHPEDRPKTDAAVRQAMNPEGDGRLDLIHRVVHADGRVLWLHQRSQTTFHAVDGRMRPLRTVGSAMDVTERQQIEQELRATKLRNEEAVRSAQFGTFEHNHLEDPGAQNVYWSPRFREILGASEHESGTLQAVVSRVPPEDAEFVRAAVTRAHDPNGDGYYDVEHRYMHPTLGTRWFLTRSSTQFGEVGGKRVPVRTVGAVMDITARRKSEQEQEQQSQILDATSDFVAMAEPDGSLVYLNRAGRQLLGIGPAATLAGFTLHAAHAASSLRRLVDEGLPAAARDGAWRGEAELHRHDGSLVPVSQVLLSHRGHDGRVVRYSTIARDISRERQLEESMRQSQKMEAIGRLAGGIAHDFNNMLCASLALSHLAASRIGPENSAYGDLQEIIGVTERAAALTQQLLAFGRRQVLRPRVVDVGAVLTRMTSMIRRLVGEHIHLTVSVPPGAPVRVKVDPTHLEQVVLNLGINAGDAMEQGGHLGIACLVCEVAGPEAARLDLAPGRYAVIAVSDDGMGMDAQTRARVFEPFFTTKEGGRGTGLGLATVFGIIKQSGGNVVVRSEVGRGSVFEAYVPVTDEPLTEEHPPSPSAPRPQSGALILVAEDERSVRQVVVSVLERAGYRVLEASDPRFALMLARDHDGPIDLLLTDVVMPRMSGTELAQQLSAERPDLRVLFMSGYADDSMVQRGLLDPGVHFLPKPVTPDQLLDAVAAALGRS